MDVVFYNVLTNGNVAGIYTFMLYQKIGYRLL